MFYKILFLLNYFLAQKWLKLVVPGQLGPGGEKIMIRTLVVFFLTVTILLLGVNIKQRTEFYTLIDIAEKQLAIVEKQQELLKIIFTEDINIDQVRSLAVTVTAYNSDPAQTDDTPHLTASMQNVRPGVLAVSRDLLEVYGLQYGQKVVLDGYGIFVVADTMAKRWKKRVDIWIADKEAALLHGKQKSILVWIDSEGVVLKG